MCSKSEDSDNLMPQPPLWTVTTIHINDSDACGSGSPDVEPDHPETESDETEHEGATGAHCDN